jgi:hypothetical protein
MATRWRKRGRGEEEEEEQWMESVEELSGDVKLSVSHKQPMRV